ncbi:MAG TPA: TrkA family potassium uptake protein [Mycobacterium sp.]|jgi:trk system potassium uptake protein TrkA|nr:TrkA family potassium uptake protein [Mycobacterium sp.]
MKVIVIGCGRVGSALSERLAGEGHDIRVIDRNPKSRRLLPANFAGSWHPGNGYNRAVLEEAGVRQVDAFVAVTSGDNSNIVAARIAKDVYRVPIVVARIYDPRRAAIYAQLGIPTVASVTWTVGRIHQMLEYRHLEAALSFGNGETLIVRSSLPEYFTGRRLHELEVDAEIRVAEVSRTGRSFIPDRATTAAPDDVVTFVVAAHALDRLRGFLNKELGT